MATYITIFKPDHPKADIAGWVAVHILVMEEKLGRGLEKGELVHHIDFNKFNNAPENLLLLTRMQHQQLPRFQAKFIIEKGLKTEFLVWYMERRDKEDKLLELEIQLVQAQERAKRLKLKLERKKARLQ